MELSGALHANPIDERDEQLSTFAGFHYQLPCLVGIGELIVNTIVWEQKKRLRSYELLAGVFEMRPASLLVEAL
jgi:hypothetical protein